MTVKRSYVPRHYKVRYEVDVEAADEKDARIEAGYQLEVESHLHENFIVEVVEVTDATSYVGFGP